MCCIAVGFFYFIILISFAVLDWREECGLFYGLSRLM